ncbi:MAG: hypothetical protein AAF800_05960 [Planctomycetota bacterium]
MSDFLFPHSPLNDDDTLIAVYAKQRRTLDDLPYTDEFEAIYTAMYGPDGVHDEHQTRDAVFHRLHNLRKAGKLPRLGRAKSPPPRVTPAQEARLTELIEGEVGQLGKRDQLLYRPAFDTIVDAFNTETGLSLSPHDLWRIVAKLAK